MNDFTVPVVEELPVTSSRRNGIMLCYPFEEKRLEKWTAPWIIQPKLDGVRCRAIVCNGFVTLLSSEENVIDQVPHINVALSKLLPDENVELDGELYCHGMSFQDIISRTSRSVNYHPDAERIQYHVFDIVDTNSQIDRTSALNKYGFFRDSNIIEIVESSLVRSVEEVMDKYYEYLHNGYEGFILRNIIAGYVRKRSTNILKFKPHQTDYWPIVGTQEEISIHGSPKGTLGAFICNSDGTLFSVGTGLTQDQRVEYWKHREELIGKKLKVKYQALTQGRRVPRFPVAISVEEK